MGAHRHDEQGLVGVILTIVIVWALLAVLLLTRTLIAAQDIDHTVLSIKASVAGADAHLNLDCSAQIGNCPTQELPILNVVIKTAVGIIAAAQPLSAQLGQVKNDTQSINNTVTQILQNAQSINTTVVSINGLAQSIGGSVNTIHSSFVGINSDVVGSITPGLSTANNSQVATIASDVTAIKGNTDIIVGQAGGILIQATQICGDVLLVVGRICK